MPIHIFPQPAVRLCWGSIEGNIGNQQDLVSALDGKAGTDHDHDDLYEPLNPAIGIHLQNTSNPHQVTKSQVGLANVENALQLKKNEGDLFTLPEKLIPSDNDILLIEDLADNNTKKKLKLSNLVIYLTGKI